MLMRSKVRYRGRYLVIGWTIVFLAVTGTIVVRQGRSFAAQKTLATQTRERDRLREVKADLGSRISALKSRPVLGPRAAALGLHTPSDSEVVNLRFDRRP
jgi:hypothetical protein